LAPAAPPPAPAPGAPAVATPASAAPLKAQPSPGASPAPTQAPAKPPADKPTVQPAAPPTSPQIRLPNVADAADKVRPAVAFIAVRSAPVRGATRAEAPPGVGLGAR